MKSACLALFAFTLIAVPCLAADDYKFGPDSEIQEGVPQGTVTKHEWSTSKVYPGTVRDYWVYVPKQYDANQPASVMFFQDGWACLNPKGQVRAGIVFDNLIHKNEMPVTIGIFINPGVVPPTKKGQQPRKNRSLEYDTLNDAYANFLLDEILPEVGKSYKISEAPEDRALCGASSGGICAWTAAWERPDQFRKVISHIGSFTNIRGGHVYPALIRKTEKKPIRVFLQEGSNDLDNLHGNWPLSNLQMEAALKFAKYDYKFVMGDGGHSRKHGGAIFPESLRWLYRDFKNE